MDEKNLRAYMAEMIGSFALVFVSAGSAYVATVGQWQPGLVWVALASGFIYAAALAVTLPVSGGYLNPAVTIMLWVFKRLDGMRAFGLVIVQVLGAVIAGGILYLVLPSQEPARMVSHLGAPHLNPDYLSAAGSSAMVTLLKGIAFELVLTFLLVFIIFGTMLDPRAPRSLGNWANRLACLWIGLALAACTLVGFPFTGAALNPARWLGPALWDMILHADTLRNHAPYWVGPIGGALLAGWLYTALILPSEEEQRSAAPAPASAGRSASLGSTLFRAKK